MKTAPLLVFIFLSAVFNLSYSQTKTNKRPKVGLALSGGGARGLAHIGVLKAIDEAGLKIDYIAGTSMGAVIGALYAAGYTADSIETIAINENWGKLLGNTIALKDVSIEEKQEYDRYISEFEVSKMKFKLPGGFIVGQELELELTRLLMPVYTIKEFKNYPIPFKCMVTDIATGKSIELDSGNIVRALRASMAIPTVFTPVEINGKLLVDGGLVNNFPVDNVRKMGADIVIGIDISEPLKTKENIKGIPDIIMQVLSLADLKNYENQKRSCDLLISPDLGNFGGQSFERADSIIKRGLKAGINYFHTFKTLKDSLDKIAVDTFHNHKSLQNIDAIKIKNIKINGNKHIADKLILKHFDFKEEGEPSPQELTSCVQRLYGTRYFNRVQYEISPDNQGNTLLIHVKEIPDTYFKMAVNYNTFLGPSVILNATFKNKLWNGSRFIVSGNIGDSPRFKAEHLQYIEKAHGYFLKTAAYYNGISLPLYNENNLSSVYRQMQMAFDVGVYRIFNRFSMLGIGSKIEYNILKPEITNTILFSRASLFNLNHYIAYTFNSVNQKYFPTNGSYLYIEAHAITFPDARITGADNVQISKLFQNNAPNVNRPFQQLRINAIRYFYLGKKTTFITQLNAGLSFGVNSNTIFNDYAIGGMAELYRNNMPFSGSKDYEIYSPNAAIARTGIQYEFYKNLYLTGLFNAGSFHQKARDFIDKPDKPGTYIYGGSLTLGFKSFLGPVQLTAMQTSLYYNDIRLYLNVGYNF